MPSPARHARWPDQWHDQWHDQQAHRRRESLSSDQPSKVCHIDQEERLHFKGDRSERREIDDTRIRAPTGNDQARSLGQSEFPNLVVVDEAGHFVHAVLHGVKETPGRVDLCPMGQVPPVR